ncbi:unnamed protein product, partial [Cladocopium goreaui]
VIWTFMASLMLMAAAGGGNGELGALGMAESFVNMPEEPETGKWYSLLDNGEAWNLVNEIEPNDKHGNLNHFLEMNEYDMMDYGKQHLVINEFKVFDGAWFLENIDYKLGLAHCLDYIGLKIFEHHYMNNFVDNVFNGWQCLVKYVLKVYKQNNGKYGYELDGIYANGASTRTTRQGVAVWFDGSHLGLHHMVSGIDEQKLDEQSMDENMSDFTSDTFREKMCWQKEMELCDFNTWQMTESGTPYIKNVGNSYADPRPTWGNTTDSWTLVEMTQRFMDKDEPFGLIDECIFNMDGECEILTILGVEEHGFEEFGDLLDEDEEVDGPVRLPDSQPQEKQPAVPVEQRQDVSQGAVSSEEIQVRVPPGLSQPDPLGGEEPEIESVELDDGLILTSESPVKDLRAGCCLLGISQAGSKGKMFERIKKSYVQGMRRAAIDMARGEYQREEHPAQPAHLVTIMQVMLTLISQQSDFKIQMTNVNKFNKKFNPMHMSPQHPMEKVLDLKMSQNKMMVEFLFLLFLLYVQPTKYFSYSDLYGRSSQQHGAWRSADAHDGHVGDDALLLKNDEKEAVEYFITAVEVNDPEEIMAQVRNMQMCMDLPHVNLLHAEAWLWEEFRDDLQRKADASDGAFFVPIVELLKHRWDTPPGESDRGRDEDATSSRSSIANRSGDEDVRESPAREFELRMTMNLPRSEAIQNTTEEENDKIEQAMAEARASIRRGIRVLQSRATRYEELGDHEAAEEVRRQIDDMEVCIGHCARMT